MKAGDYAKAVAAYDRDVVSSDKYCRGYSAPDCPTYGRAKANAGLAHLRAGDTANGERLVREGLDILKSSFPSSDDIGYVGIESRAGVYASVVETYVALGRFDEARAFYLEGASHGYFASTSSMAAIVKSEQAVDPIAALILEIAVALSVPQKQDRYRALIEQARSNKWAGLVTQLQKAMAATAKIDPSGEFGLSSGASSTQSAEARAKAAAYAAAGFPSYGKWYQMEAAVADRYNRQQAEEAERMASTPSFSEQLLAAMNVAVQNSARSSGATRTSATGARPTGGNCSNTVYVIRWTTRNMGETETRVSPRQFVASTGSVDAAISQTRSQIAAIQANPYPGNERALAQFRSFEGDLQRCR
ncbi:MAG: hypothetical protein JSR47_24695 [Proteobacteria bacterium]|nr:hypothetical protein [Pseudomonadota bacterium]